MSKDEHSEPQAKPDEPVCLWTPEAPAAYRLFLDVLPLESTLFLLLADVMANPVVVRRLTLVGKRDKVLMLARWVDQTRGLVADCEKRMPDGGEPVIYPAHTAYAVAARRWQIEHSLSWIADLVLADEDRIAADDYSLVVRLHHVKNLIAFARRRRPAPTPVCCVTWRSCPPSVSLGRRTRCQGTRTRHG